MQLARRSQLVLQLVIDTYIHTAQPVSSQALQRKLAERARRGASLPRGLSGATLRATMAELEGLGLLVQPHVSAGRIPTDAGLRLYVDALLAPKLRPWDRQRLADAAADGDGDAGASNGDGAGATAADTGAAAAYPARLGRRLARLTGQVALVAVPSLLGSTLREVGLVRLGDARVLAYFVTPSGHVQQKVVALEADVDATTLLAVQNRLNALLARGTLAQVRRALEDELHEATGQHDALRAQAARMGRKLWPTPSWEVVVEGRAELLLQPEFADRIRLHELLRAIEHKALLLTLVDDMLAHPGVLVRLSSEHARQDLCELAYVGCAAAGGAGAQAAVGLFGPARMDYGRLMPLVAHASQLLARFCAQL